MNKLFHYLILFFFAIIISCNKEKTDPIVFRPTDHVVGTLGAKMRFVIEVPQKISYNFCAIDSALNCEGESCKDFLVPLAVMEETAQNLSDTILFQWQIMTATSPYPQNHCKLLIYEGSSNGFMCSIGNGSHACDILNELSKSFSGDSKAAFDEIIGFLQD